MTLRVPTSAKVYARAAIMWGVAGGIIFIPCAMMLVALAWLLNAGWVFPALVALGILLTYGGVYLFFSGGIALLEGRPGWQLKLSLAPWFAWNVLLGLSLLHAGEVIYAAVTPGVLPPPYGVFFDVCVALHLIANAAFIIGYQYIREPAREAAPRGTHA